MARQEIIKWMANLKSDIGNAEHQSLWHYEQAIDMAIRELQDRPTGTWANQHEDGHGFWCGTCDRCGKEGDVSMFCPNCGAYMRGDDDGNRD